jgi:hypothetical protein
MTWVFSKRCKNAIREGKIKVSVPRNVRYRIWKLFQNFNMECYETDETGYSYLTSYLYLLAEKIKNEHGLDNLYAFPEKEEGSPEPSDLEGFVLRGTIPSYLFDAIELFYDLIQDENKLKFQREFNQIMEESNLSWRMADGKIFPIDSAYIDEQILSAAYSLLHEVKFLGALQEFDKARTDFNNGDYEGAIQNANNAVESTIKGILKIEKIKPGELFRGLIDSGLVPEYYSGFLKAFEENILRSVAIIRNEELGVGHGRGANMKEIPRSLAELALNLAGVLIKYLITTYLEFTKEETSSEPQNDDALPF